MRVKKKLYPLTQNVLHKKDIDAAIRVIKSKKITMGTKTKEIEKYFSEKITKNYSLMVNSGSSANLLIFQCLINPLVKKLKRGDEVLISSICWSTSLWPIIQSGLNVKFVDIDLRNLNIDLDDLKNKITKRTKALMLVHALGNCTNMLEISRICKNKKIILIEDTCEALGSSYKGKNLGRFGNFSSFSFYYSHHITSGEGGMVCTNNKKYYEILKTLRSHGWNRELSNKSKIIKKYKKIHKDWVFINSGFNLRPTDINAAIGLEQLKRLKKILNIRRENFEKIRLALINDKRFNGQFEILKENNNSKIAWFGVPIILNTKNYIYKNKVMKKLQKKGVENRPLISGNFANQPSIKLYKINVNYNLKNANKIENSSFFIGLHNIRLNNLTINYLKNSFYSSL